ncbi:unnamed protein product [Choristocarpus tenellus]
MAGLGRRTLYRKSVTDNYLNSLPEPGDDEEIALVQAPRGSNIIEILLASGEQALAILPTRFRKLIWVKRGDFLIASTSTGDFENSAGEAGKVRHRVEHILNKDQVKHLKKVGLWPEAFATVDKGGVCLSQCQKEQLVSGRAAGYRSSACTDTGEGKGLEDGRGSGSIGSMVGEEDIKQLIMTAGESGEGYNSGYDTEDDMSDLVVNNNRVAMMQLRVDHDDEDEDSSDGE